MDRPNLTASRIGMVDTISSCIRFRLRSSTHLLAPLSGRMRMGVWEEAREFGETDEAEWYTPLPSPLTTTTIQVTNVGWVHPDSYSIQAMLCPSTPTTACRRYSLGSHSTSRFSVSLSQLHHCSPFTLNCGRARSTLKPVG